MANIVKKPKGLFIKPRDLTISWSDNKEYWSWHRLPSETSSKKKGIKAAELLAVCWLEVKGKFNTRELTANTMYEVVYVVKLKETASGWERLVKLKLKLPNVPTPQERKESFEAHIGKGWVDIRAGEFMTSPENDGNISFSLNEHETNFWKSGLVVKGVAIRPKN